MKIRVAGPLLVTLRRMILTYFILLLLNCITNVGKKRCYRVRIKQDSAATEGDLNRFGCDIIFIIGHGQKIDGQDYVKLKDGNICISNYNKNGIHCEGIGCYISGEKGTIPHTHALRKLAKKIQNLYNSPDCPGKTVCVFSGPVNV